MKHKYFKITLCLLILTVVFSCVGCGVSCSGYTSRIPSGDYEKINKIVFGLDGNEYIFETGDDFDTFVTTIKKTLKSGKIDWAFASGKVLTNHSDFFVSMNKGGIWLEIFIENGKYKKIFFTMDLKDTQTFWIYSTTTESYDDGNFMLYCDCDCKDLVALVNFYNATNTEMEAFSYGG